MTFAANFMRFSAVKEFLRSVNIWQSYNQSKNGAFLWLTVYSTLYFTLLRLSCAASLADHQTSKA